MFFHAGFDPALTWRNLTTELRDVGLACLENGPRTGAHLRHRPGCAEQQDGTSNHDSLLQHDRSSIALHCLDCAAVSFHQDYSRKTSPREAEPIEGEKDCC